MSTDVSIKAALVRGGETGSSEALRCGRYLLQESLGTGGMAQVYRAVLPMMHGDFGKTVAIKRILSCFTDEQEFVDLLLDEARLTLRLQHPNIVQTYEVGVDDGSYFIAMEYVDGLPLSALLRKVEASGEPFPIDVAVYIAMSVAAGLHAAHSLVGDDGAPMAVVHRDVSPHNIMVSSAGQVKIIDFGVAKAKDRLVRTVDGAIRGRLSFFSPERVSAGRCDHRSDLFALGLVLWIMLTGEHPMKGLGQVESMLAMETWEIPHIRERRANVSPSLERVVRRVLDPDPELRHADGEALRADLARVVLGKDPVFSSNRVERFLVRLDRRVRRIAANKGPNADDSGVLPHVRSGEAGIVRTARRTQSVAPLGALPPDVPQEPTPLDKRVDEEQRESEADNEEECAADIELASSLVCVTRDDACVVQQDEDVSERPTQIYDEFAEDALRAVAVASTRRRARGSIWVMVGLMIVSALLGAFAVVLLTSEQPHRTHEKLGPVDEEGGLAPPVAMVQLELDSGPSGASVLINGEPTGTKTPAVLDLPPEQIRVTLRREGYEPKDVTVVLSPGRRTVMHIELMAAHASVVFEIQPSTTAVLYFPSLDKRYLIYKGRSVVVDGLRVGHKVEFEVRRDGKNPVSRAITPRRKHESVVLNVDK